MGVQAYELQGKAYYSAVCDLVGHKGVTSGLPRVWRVELTQNSQRLQYPLIKEYALILIRVPIIF